MNTSFSLTLMVFLVPSVLVLLACFSFFRRQFPQAKMFLSIATFVISVLVSIVCLFTIGNLGVVRAFSSIPMFATIKLALFFLITISIFSLANNILFLHLSQFSIKRWVGVFFAVIFSIYVSLLLNDKYVFVTIGGFLRDAVGINWFFMDWAGWTITYSIFLTATISAIIVYLKKKLSKKAFAVFVIILVGCLVTQIIFYRFFHVILSPEFFAVTIYEKTPIERQCKRDDDCRVESCKMEAVNVAYFSPDRNICMVEAGYPKCILNQCVLVRK